MTIGGDLYEHERAGAATAEFLVRPSPPGADSGPAGPRQPRPAGAREHLPRTRWPENVHLFRSSRLEPFHLGEGLTVWGLGHEEPAWTGNPLAAELRRVRRPPGTGAASTSRSSTGRNGLPARRQGSPRPLRGRRHPGEGAMPSRSAATTTAAGRPEDRTCLPGQPRPLAFDETGPGARCVEVDTDVRSVHRPRHQPAGTRDRQCRLNSVGSITAAVDRVSAEVLTATAGCRWNGRRCASTWWDRWPPASGSTSSTSRARSVRSPGDALRVRDLTRAGRGPGGPRRGGETRGTFVRMAIGALAAAGSHEERAVVADALRYGLEAFAGSEVGLR